MVDTLLQMAYMQVSSGPIRYCISSHCQVQTKRDRFSHFHVACFNGSCTRRGKRILFVRKKIDNPLEMEKWLWFLHDRAQGTYPLLYLSNPRSLKHHIISGYIGKERHKMCLFLIYNIRWSYRCALVKHKSTTNLRSIKIITAARF